MSKGIAIAFVALVFTVAFIMMLLPIFITRINLVGIVNIETRQDTVQLMLLTLLSSTYDHKPIQQVIAEHIAMKKYPDIQKILSDKLDALTDCYKIQTTSEILAESKNPSCDLTTASSGKTFSAETNIPLPFGQNSTKKILMVING